MKINFTRLKSSSPDFKKIKQLYVRAFPDEERAPFLMLVLKSRKEGVDFWSVRCDGEWVGMLYIVSYADLSYVFYLAVSEEHRGRGIGSAILRAARHHYKNRRLFLAIEQTDTDAENQEQRLERKNFYIRNGFEELHKKLREGRTTRSSCIPTPEAYFQSFLPWNSLISDRGLTNRKLNDIIN